MTLPRLLPSTIVCRIVLLAANCTIIPQPVSSIKTSDSHNQRDCENPTSPSPNTIVETTITRPNPNTLDREARYTAPATAPTPEAAVKNPSVCGPPRSTSA